MVADGQGSCMVFTVSFMSCSNIFHDFHRYLTPTEQKEAIADLDLRPRKFRTFTNPSYYGHITFVLTPEATKKVLAGNRYRIGTETYGAYEYAHMFLITDQQW